MKIKGIPRVYALSLSGFHRDGSDEDLGLLYRHTSRKTLHCRTIALPLMISMALLRISIICRQLEEGQAAELIKQWEGLEGKFSWMPYDHPTVEEIHPFWLKM